MAKASVQGGARNDPLLLRDLLLVRCPLAPRRATQKASSTGGPTGSAGRVGPFRRKLFQGRSRVLCAMNGGGRFVQGDRCFLRECVQQFLLVLRGNEK